MNFNVMWSVQNHTDLLYVSLENAFTSALLIAALLCSFWEVALPVMAVVIPLFLKSDIAKMLHYAKKKLVIKRKMMGFNYLKVQ